SIVRERRLHALAAVLAAVGLAGSHLAMAGGMGTTLFAIIHRILRQMARMPPWRAPVALPEVGAQVGLSGIASGIANAKEPKPHVASVRRVAVPPCVGSHSIMTAAMWSFRHSRVRSSAFLLSMIPFVALAGWARVGSAKSPAKAAAPRMRAAPRTNSTPRKHAKPEGRAVKRSARIANICPVSGAKAARAARSAVRRAARTTRKARAVRTNTSAAAVRSGVRKRVSRATRTTDAR